MRGRMRRRRILPLITRFTGASPKGEAYSTSFHNLLCGTHLDKTQYKAHLHHNLRLNSRMDIQQTYYLQLIFRMLN